MPIARSVKRTIYIRPSKDVMRRLVYVEISRPGDASFTRSFYIPGSARAYPVVADHGDTVKTWIKNITVLPNGQRVYSNPSDPVIFSIPPAAVSGLDKPSIEVNHYPEPKKLAKDQDAFKETCSS